MPGGIWGTAIFALGFETPATACPEQEQVLDTQEQFREALNTRRKEGAAQAFVLGRVLMKDPSVRISL